MLGEKSPSFGGKFSKAAFSSHTRRATEAGPLGHAAVRRPVTMSWNRFVFGRAFSFFLTFSSYGRASGRVERLALPQLLRSHFGKKRGLLSLGIETTGKQYMHPSLYSSTIIPSVAS
eukprot:GHVT01105456.1.p1 GENE.GHVT01105456.1~~GHVT01105456.1.p1  ORF type:complete len:117 (-),score=3.59 GHVT01105456.1:107-457(-)